MKLASSLASTSQEAGIGDKKGKKAGTGPGAGPGSGSGSGAGGTVSGASKVLEQANIEKAKVLQKEEGEMEIKGGVVF